MPLDLEISRRMTLGCRGWLGWGLSLLAAGAVVHADEIKVLSAGAFKPVLVALQSDFESQSGTPIYCPCDGKARYVADQLGGDGIWILHQMEDGSYMNIILWMC